MPLYRNRLISTVLTFFTYIIQSKLLQQIAYLKAENEILRNRIPGRIQTTPAERALLVRLAKPLGEAVHELVSIVHFKTLLRWIREETTPKPHRTNTRAGRPSISENTVALILRMAGESGWGYGKICGELLKLGIRVAPNTVKKVLIKNGHHPSPGRTFGDWTAFLKRHWETLWACDFFCKDVWTARGKVTFYVLFFIKLSTRRVHITNWTCAPDGPWVEQQARNLLMTLQDTGEEAGILLRDGDTKFTTKFEEIFESEHIRVKQLPYRSPNLNAFAERFVQSIKDECLNHFTVFGERHLELLIREYERYYNNHRPHQGLGNRTIGCVPFADPQVDPPELHEVDCAEHLGGLLRHYQRKVA